MAKVLEESVLAPRPKDLLRGIRLLLTAPTRATPDMIQLAIQGLMRLRAYVDGANPLDIWREVDTLREAGQKEYAHDETKFDANFERVGNDLGVAPRIVLKVYLFKHLDGIEAHFDGHTSQREPVQGRINDAIVYCALLKGMLLCGK